MPLKEWIRWLFFYLILLARFSLYFSSALTDPFWTVYNTDFASYALIWAPDIQIATVPVLLAVTGMQFAFDSRFPILGFLFYIVGIIELAPSHTNAVIFTAQLFRLFIEYVFERKIRIPYSAFFTTPLYIYLVREREKGGGGLPMYTSISVAAELAYHYFIYPLFFKSFSTV